MFRSRRDPTSGGRSYIAATPAARDRKSTRLNSSHSQISYAVFCLKKKIKATGLAALREIDHTALVALPEPGAYEDAANRVLTPRTLLSYATNLHYRIAVVLGPTHA